MYVSLCVDMAIVSACSRQGSCESLEMCANNWTLALCRSYMPFTTEPFIQPLLFETGSLINSARTAGQWAGQWAPGILLSLEFPSAGFCAWLLRHVDPHVCVPVRQAHDWQPSPHWVFLILLDKVSHWACSLPGKHFTDHVIAPAHGFGSFCGARSIHWALHTACKSQTSKSPPELLAFNTGSYYAAQSGFEFAT